MPAPHRPTLAVRRALRRLGRDIKVARIRRNLTMETVAKRAFTSRPTLQRIERGDPGVGIGIYAGVLHALGLLENLRALADPHHDEIGLAYMDENLPQRARPKQRRPKDDPNEG